VKKLKILYDYIPAYRPIKTGIPIFTEELYKALVKEAAKRDIMIEKTFDLSKYIPRKPHKVFRFFERLLYHDIYLPFKLYFGKYDYYIENNYMFIPIFKPKHTKIVNIVYDIGQILFDNIHTKRNIKRWRRRFKKSINNCDIILTISKTSQNDIEAYVKENRIDHLLKIDYIYADAAISILKHTKSDVQKCLSKFHIDKPYFLFLGTLEPRKNPLRLVQGFHRFKQETNRDMKLVFAGKKGWLYEDVFDYIKCNKLENDIVFTEYVTDKEKSILMQEMVAFVFPSIYEGFGIPPLEALKYKKPVIVSDIPVFRELFEDNVLYVNPYSIDQIAQQLNRVLIDPPKIDDSILRKFSWQGAENKLIEILQSCKSNL